MESIETPWELHGNLWGTVKYRENGQVGLGSCLPFRYTLNTPLRLVSQVLEVPVPVGNLLQTLLFQILKSKFLEIENIKILISKSCSTFKRREFALFCMGNKQKHQKLITHFSNCHIEVLKIYCRHCKMVYLAYIQFLTQQIVLNFSWNFKNPLKFETLHSLSTATSPLKI